MGNILFEAKYSPEGASDREGWRIGAALRSKSVGAGRPVEAFYFALAGATRRCGRPSDNAAAAMAPAVVHLGRHRPRRSC
jgi:hypothetical protein